MSLYLAEGDRWLRVLPEGQVGDMPEVSESALASALTAAGPTPHRMAPLPGPPTLLTRYSALSGWQGILCLRGAGAGRQSTRNRLAGPIAEAISRSLDALQRAELSREQAIGLERSRWAVELHDGHLQTLSSVKMHAEVCQVLEQQHRNFCDAYPPGSPARLERELARLCDLLGATIREARQFLIELRSPPVSAEQFLPWLRAYVDDFSRQTALKIVLRVEGEGELPQNQVEEATRLICEAMTNVRKHAEAGNVLVAVAFAEHGTSISVSDDGVGFDVRGTLERLAESSRNGLIGVRYRAESIGGEMRLKSEVGQGTTVFFRLPKGRARAALRDRP